MEDGCVVNVMLSTTVQRWCGYVCDSVEEYSDVQSLVRAAALRHPLLAPTTGESQVASERERILYKFITQGYRFKPRLAFFTFTSVPDKHSNIQ